MRHAGLNNPCLFPRDFFYRISENFDMIPADISCNGQQWRQDISGVEPAAQSRFDNGDIDLLSGKIVQGQRGD